MKAKKISPNDMKLYVLSFPTSNDLTFGTCFLFACFPVFFFFFFFFFVCWCFPFYRASLVALFPVSCFLAFLSVCWLVWFLD